MRLIRYSFGRRMLDEEESHYMLKTRKWLAVTSAAMAATLAVAGCGSSGTADSSAAPGANSTPGPTKALTKLVIAVPGISAGSAFLEIGVRSGIMKKYGLDVEINRGVKGPDTPAALINGSIDASQLTGTAIKAHAKGLAIVNVVYTATNEPFVLLAAPGITSLNDLAGKSIATSGSTQTPGLQTAGLLDKAGLADKVKVINLTSTPAISALYVSKQADAEYVALNQALTDSNKRPGSTILLDNSDLPPTPATGLAVAQAFLTDHPDVVKALAKSCLEAAHMMKSEPDKAAPYIAQAYGLSADQTKRFLEFEAKNIEVSGVPKPEYFDNVAAVYNTTPGSDTQWTGEMVAQSWDTSLAQQAAKELGYR